MERSEAVDSRVDEAPSTVLWCSREEAPLSLITHLRSRGLLLRTGSEDEPCLPARLAPIESVVPGSARPTLKGRRIAILHPDPGHADAQAQALRFNGAEVVVLGLDPRHLERAETFDPDVVLIEPEDFVGSCWEMVRAIWQHSRLRWATVVLAPPEPLGLGNVISPNAHRPSFTVHALCADYDEAVAGIAHAGEELWECALEMLGPARVLRILLASGHRLRARFTTPSAVIEVDVAHGIIAGARGGSSDQIDDSLLGPHALAQLLDATLGTVRVWSVEGPAVTNVMAPLDTALHVARVSLTEPPVVRVTSGTVPRSTSANELGSALHVPPMNAQRPSKLAIPPPPIAERIEAAQAAHAAQAQAAQAAQVQAAQAARPALRLVETDAALMAAATGVHRSAEAPRAPLRLVKEEPVAEEHTSPEPAESNRLLQQSTGELAASLVDTAPFGFQWQKRKHPMLYACLVPLAVCLVWLVWPNSKVTKSVTASATPSAAILPPPAPAGQASVLDAPAALPNAVAPANDETLDDDDTDSELETGSPTRKQLSKRASSLVSEGHSFRRAGNLAAARNRYQAALGVFAAYPRAYAGLAQLAILEGDGPEAVRNAQRVLKLRPGELQYYVLLGDAYHVAGRLSEARIAYQAAARRGSQLARERLE